ncbi:MAG: polysaccharide biosynthesis tyrosine autokinase [Sedimentisphaerales bacterium]|jgi:capsular exopolysaccharide synthesis family protein
MTETGQKPVIGEPRTTTPRTATVARGAAAEMTPKEILAILRRHWFMIALLTVLGLGCGVGSYFLILRYWPKYTAQALIRVLPPVEKDPTMIQPTVVAKEIQYGYRLSMAGLLQSQNMLQQLTDRDKIQQTKWFQNFGNIRDVRIKKAIKDLQKHFDSVAQRDGDFIVVSMTCHDKVESALIVNEMVSLFLINQGGTTRKDVADKLSQLETQQVRVQRDLTLAENALDDVRRRYGFADLEEHAFQSVTDTKLSDLELQQDKLVLDISETRANIEQLAAQAEGPVQVQVERQVETDLVMNALAEQLALRESDLASALAKFGEDHRAVHQIREYINAIQEERLRRKAVIAEQTRQSNLKNAQDTLITMEQRLDELEKRRDEAAKRKEEMDLARVQFQQRVAIRDERKTMLDSIKEQIEKLKIIHDDPETPKVQFVDIAPEPLEESFPRLVIFLPGGTLLGLLLGIGLAFLVELLNDLVRTPKDVAMYLHIPLLGIIPDAEEDEQLENIELALVVRQAPNSIISESYRRVRTNLKLSSLAEKAKTILITSGGANDGKTAVAINLATALVADGKKVLLIDTNFRRPVLQRIFAVERGNTNKVNAGLSTLLSGQCGLQDVIRPSGMERLDIIESGPMPASPADALGGEAMERLVKQQKDSYDYVVLDGPPVLLASEAKMLAKCVDGTILVFNAAKTRRGAAARTISELKQVNAEILGCVLLGVKMLKGGYFREMFESYQEYQTLEPAKT